MHGKEQRVLALDPCAALFPFAQAGAMRPAAFATLRAVPPTLVDDVAQAALDLKDSGYMRASLELSGIVIVGSGSFNPAIFQPHWLERKDLISSNAAQSALSELVVTPDLTAFTADWLSVQVGLQQLVFATVDEGRDVDLRDVGRGVLSLLPETPVDAVGVNADAHFRVESEAQWHALGDTLAPKKLWESVFGASDNDWRHREDGGFVGLRTMTVETHRTEPLGYVRIEVAPSLRVLPHGVYVGINTHFQLTEASGDRSNGYEAARALGQHWDATRALERQLVARLMEEF